MRSFPDREILQEGRASVGLCYQHVPTERLAAVTILTNSAVVEPEGPQADTGHGLIHLLPPSVAQPILLLI
jgi:hypothetical protein